MVLGYAKRDDEEKVTSLDTLEVDPVPSGREPDRTEHAIGVVEQRISNLAQGSLCLVLMTGPFLHVLNVISRGERELRAASDLIYDDLIFRFNFRSACRAVVSVSMHRLYIWRSHVVCFDSASWFMGTDALITNGITTKLLYLLRDRRLTDHSDPLSKVRKSRLLLFLGIELAGFGATMAITQTVGESSRPD